MTLGIIALESALGLTAFWVFIFGFWRPYRIDAFRDHVFSVRDRLFLYAAEGHVKFDDPAYILLRDLTNAVLRYAHEITLSKLLVGLFVYKRASAPKSKERIAWERAVKRQPREVAKQLEEFNTILAIAILQLTIYRSFFLYLLVRPLMRFIKEREELSKRPNVFLTVEQLESEALQDEARKECEEVLVG